MATNMTQGAAGANASPDQHQGAGLSTTVTVNDELLCKARTYTGIAETSALIDRALKCLVEREASRQLARLHGYAPGLSDIRAAGGAR